MESFNFETKSLYFTSLGCSKNLVDSQVMLGHMGLDGFEVCSAPEDAEVIVVNTCSFIEAAKTESIETILDLADYKDKDHGKCKALVVSGCMAQRYSDELEREMPEVDLFIGTGEYYKIVPLLSALKEGKLEKKSFVEIPKYIHSEFDPRVNTSPFYTAWLKVSEGCNRNCTFCIIPTIRGKLRSRSVESLVSEANKLVSSGVRELNIISQDLSDYGSDLDDKNKIYNLLQGLTQVEGLDWVRLFYYYPDDLTEDVIEILSQENNICLYLDMPIQHFSTSVLKRMNRKITTEQMYNKIKRLKEKIPNIVLRTSVIVGFPGETEKDFSLLKKGIIDCEFDHLGVFKYSDEEGTAALKLNEKVSTEVIEHRFNELYQLQKNIVEKKNQRYLGQELDVLIEGAHDETDLLLQGRHSGQAPDIDGKVIINDGLAYPGEIVKVMVTDIHEYDLIGRVIN